MSVARVIAGVVSLYRWMCIKLAVALPRARGQSFYMNGVNEEMKSKGMTDRQKTLSHASATGRGINQTQIK